MRRRNDTKRILILFWGRLLNTWTSGAERNFLRNRWLIILRLQRFTLSIIQGRSRGVFWQNSCPTTNFLGNSIDLVTHGHSHIFFENNNDHFFYINPFTRIHNIILGSMWIEHFGELRIKNMNGSAEAVIIFTKSGLFQGCQYKVSGYIYNREGKKIVKIEGRWDRYLEVRWLENTKKVKKGTTKRLWEIPENFELPKNGSLPPFSASLNEIDDRLSDILLPTDSRRRLDRIFLEKGDYDTATYYKKVMEDRQRSDRKKRTNEWSPLWFKQIDDDTHETKRMWVYSGDYWEQRQKKVTLLECGAKKEASELLFPEKVVGLACNFMAYNGPSKNLSKSTEPDSSSETKNNEDLNTVIQTTQSIEKTSDESPSTVTLKEENL